MGGDERRRLAGFQPDPCCADHRACAVIAARWHRANDHSESITALRHGSLRGEPRQNHLMTARRRRRPPVALPGAPGLAMTAKRIGRSKLGRRRNPPRDGCARLSQPRRQQGQSGFGQLSDEAIVSQLRAMLEPTLAKARAAPAAFYSTSL
jgi:hypothetical protein